MAPREPEIDDAMLQRAAAGDVAAATLLIRRYERLVHVTAARVLGTSSDEVRDVAQETFLRVISRLSTFDPHGRARLSTWISTIAVRLAIDVSRRSRRVISSSTRSMHRLPTFMWILALPRRPWRALSRGAPIDGETSCCGAPQPRFSSHLLGSRMRIGASRASSRSHATLPHLSLARSDSGPSPCSIPARMSASL